MSAGTQWQDRPIRILTPDGVEAVQVASEDEASLVGDYWNAVQRFLATGDVIALEPFEGQRVAGRPLETDPFEVETAAWRGELIFEDIYVFTV